MRSRRALSNSLTERLAPRRGLFFWPIQTRAAPAFKPLILKCPSPDTTCHRALPHSSQGALRTITPSPGASLPKGPGSFHKESG